MARELIHRRVVDAFVACFGSTYLRDVDALFTDLGFGLDGEAEQQALQSGRGERRSRAAGYVGSLDLGNGRDADLLLQAIGLSLTDWEREEAENKIESNELKRLRRNLDLSGFDWDGKRVTRRAGPIPTPFVERLAGHEDVEREVERILASVGSDPADAITAARSLVEAACKTTLEELGEVVNDHDDLPVLYKKTALALNIDATQHDVVYRQILQGLMSAVQGLAELRNKLGDAHSPSRRSVRPLPRHARMAAGAATTVATFLIETLEERRLAAATSTPSPTEPSTGRPST